jgi:hypothetical protein
VHVQMLMHWHLRMQVWRATIRCDERHPTGSARRQRIRERHELFLGGEPRLGARGRGRVRPCDGLGGRAAAPPGGGQTAARRRRRQRDARAAAGGRRAGTDGRGVAAAARAARARPRRPLSHVHQGGHRPAHHPVAVRDPRDRRHGAAHLRRPAQRRDPPGATQVWTSARPHAPGPRPGRHRACRVPGAPRRTSSSRGRGPSVRPVCGRLLPAANGSGHCVPGPR